MEQFLHLEICLVSAHKKFSVLRADDPHKSHVTVRHALAWWCHHKPLSFSI